MKGSKQGILASYEYLDSAVEAVEALRMAGFPREAIQAYAPMWEHNLEHAMGQGQSPVRVFALVGGLTGAATGFALALFASTSWPMVTGGKPIVSVPAFLVIALELSILFGALATVLGLLIHTRLPRLKPLAVYDPEFSAGRFGVYVSAGVERLEEARGILEAQGPAVLRDDPEGVGHV